MIVSLIRGEYPVGSLELEANFETSGLIKGDFAPRITMNFLVHSLRIAVSRKSFSKKPRFLTRTNQLKWSV